MPGGAIQGTRSPKCIRAFWNSETSRGEKRKDQRERERESRRENEERPKD